jgi:hypothetical protein
VDGTIGDRFLNGRRLRPATLEYALANFPKIVVKLLQGKLLVSTAKSVEDRDVVILRDVLPTMGPAVFLLREDFEICKQISTKVRLRTFPTDRLEDAEAKAAAYVRVEFAGRGVPQ